MELYVGVVGIIAGVFVVIFGGRGLIDLVRGYSERRRARLAAADDSPGVAAVATAETTIAEEPREPAGPTAAVPLVEPDPVYRRTFVGRDAELGQLHVAFDEALAGHGSLAMVVGEPGIGKTSLCEQLAGHVAEKGGKTLVGHCYEEGSLSLPYLAFVEAVRSHVLVLEPEDLKAQLGHGAGELARIVPEIRERMQVGPPPSGDPEEERYRLLQAASDFLRRAASEQPLLVVLEDLHDADRGTLDMLTHLARNLSGSRLLVVGTYRDVQVDRTHPLAGALAELRRVTSFERIPLRGLTQDEVHRMLRAIVGHDVPWRWAEVVHRQTEGNPLFVQEVMRYLVEEGLLERPEGELQSVGDELLAGKIPEGLRDVIGKRMTRLSKQCNEVLSLASVIGREFGLDVLERVAELGEEPLYAALEEAAAAAVVEHRSALGGAVTFRFTHAFFRQTLYEEMFVPRRNRLHQQVGGAMETVYAGRREEHATEMAEHFSHSNNPEDLGNAMGYGEMAAAGAMDIFAYSEAARLWEQALQLLEMLRPEDKAKRCDLLFDLARALMPTAGFQRIAEEIAPEALAIAESLGDGRRAFQACRIAMFGLRRSGGAGQITPEFAHWAELADQYAMDGTSERVTADTNLARVKNYTGHYAEAVQLIRRALEEARKHDDPETLFDAARGAMLYLHAPELHAERLRLAEEFTTRPSEGVGAASVAQVLEYSVRSFIENGDRARAESVWHRITDLGERTRHFEPLLASSQLEVLFAIIDGLLVHALGLGERLVAEGTELGVPERAAQRIPMLRQAALLYLGRGQEALEDAHLLRRTQTNPTPAEALCLAYVGRTEEARTSLVEFTANSLGGDTPRTFFADALEAAVLIGARDVASAVMELLSAARGPAVFAAGGGWIACPARHMGAAAALLGRPDEAATYYQEALEACRKIRFRPEIALTRLQLAELLLDRYPDERAEAIEHLDFAISEFREMKMQASSEKAEALRVAQTN